MCVHSRKISSGMLSCEKSGESVVQDEADGLAEHFRLFTDLLQHEMRIAALLSCFHIPVYTENLRLNFLPFYGPHADAICCNGQNAMLRRKQVLAVRNQSCNIGCDECSWKRLVATIGLTLRSADGARRSSNMECIVAIFSDGVANRLIASLVLS